MDYKIYAVRIGDKYGVHYEHTLEQKLGPITWIREEEPGVHLQWNKLSVFSVSEDCPVVLIDIDLEFINDYTSLFLQPVQRGEFLVTRNWWWQDNGTARTYKFAGGFYKFFPEDTRYIYETFRQDSEYWQAYYIDQGITVGPVNGEMNFVEDMVRGRIGTTQSLKMKFVPDHWHTQWKNNRDDEYMSRMTKQYKHDYLWMGEFHPDIKMVHYQRESPLPSSGSRWMQAEKSHQTSSTET